MARGNQIIVTANPKGTFHEGIITDTSKPGQLMMLKPATGKAAGEFSWQAATVGVDGAPALIAVLLPDYLQGKLPTDAYVAGTRGFLYSPIAGEDINVLVGEGAGTSNSFAIGDRFMLDADGNGLIPVSGTPTSVPFICMEAVTQVAGHNLTWCKYTGG